MNDQELVDVLGATTVRREPWPYASTAPMEELHVDGRLAGRRLLLKHLAPGGDTARPAPADDPLRELKVYQQVLAPRAIDAPICHAAVDAPPRGWLVPSWSTAYPCGRRAMSPCGRPSQAGSPGCIDRARRRQTALSATTPRCFGGAS